jgi:hypothetical protein
MTICDSPPEPPELRKVESGPTFEVWRMRSSMLRLEWSRAGHIAILRLIVVGHGHAELAGPCIRRWNREIDTSEQLPARAGGGQLGFLVDHCNMPTCDSRFCTELAGWAVEHRARLEPIHLLTRSSLVSMGVAVASLALGEFIKTYTLRTSFDLAVRELERVAKPRSRG